MCRHLHKQLGFAEDPEQLYELEKSSEKGALRFRSRNAGKVAVDIRGPVSCRGLTSDIVFIMGLKRRTGDVQYRGYMMIMQLLMIHYSRCRKRLYPFIHDLTKVSTGCSRPLHSEVRRLSFYTRLRERLVQIWTEEMGVRTDLVKM